MIITPTPTTYLDKYEEPGIENIAFAPSPPSIFSNIGGQRIESIAFRLPIADAI